MKKDFDIELLEPVPIIKLGEDIVMTDGHTRTTCLIQKGFQYIPTIKETEKLDWEAYSININDCKEKGILSALDLVKYIVPKDIFEEKWDKYCDDVHNKLLYEKDPCNYSALPYWKETTFTKPDNIKVYHESEWNKLSKNAKKEFIKVDKFFRIKHNLEQINNEDLPKNCRYRTFDPNNEKDFDKALEIIQISYPNTDLTKDKLKEYIKNDVYKNELWIFIDKINNGMYTPIAFGIAEFDSLVKEGILEWIQVLPEYRGKGFGKFLVAELLRRMKGKAKFATVSGDCNNISNPIGLYRKTGFAGDSIWYIAYKS
ncbi:GNAT family N-acetyltransferase [Schnuerera sp.]|uniref:GNAT family N-acetyltransferase n=1 Tax=Schnuerera sp. TaxID=2794844 RepID=UPI002C0BEA96|nr:GNAT family N-acetyltransferase [Schnuerera sp.]HSH34800.1 GNAT family N-acetyltransferase [Schnuerera sp.]